MGYLYLFIEVVFISAATASGLYILASVILGKPLNIKLGLLYAGIMIGVQMSANVYLIVTENLNMYIWNALFSLYSILLGFILYKKYKIRFIICLSASAISYFVVVTCLNLFGAIIPNITNLPDNYYESITEMKEFIIYSLVYGDLPYLLMFVFSIGVAFFLKKMHFYKYYKHLFNTKPRAITTLTISLLLMNVYYIIAIAFPQLEKVMPFYIIMFFVIILVLYTVQFIAMYMESKERLRMQQIIIAQQQAYTRSLEDLQQGMRAFRHDFQNIMAGAAMSVSEGDMEGVRHFLNNTTGYFDKVIGDEIHNMSQLGNLSHPELKSLLSVKLADARRSGIQTQLEILYPVQNIPLAAQDIVRCVGILLDNALYQAAKEKNGMVRIIILQEKHEQRIVIANSCTERPALQQMRKNGYTTKGAGRGTGLSSYRRILEAYPQVITRTAWEEGMFIQEMRIHT